MKDAISLSGLIAGFITLMFGISHLERRQHQRLEAVCHCVCIRITDPTDADYQEWFDTRGVLTMAWGGGMWRCRVKP